MDNSSPKSSRRFRWRGEIAEILTLGEEAASKIRSVLRLEPDDRIVLVDDAGSSHLAELVEVSRARVRARIIGDAANLLPAAPVAVALAIIKGKRMDWAVEKLGEIGVERIIPLFAERSVVGDVGREKLERWRRIAASAAMQSGHAEETVIEDPVGELPSLIERFSEICLLDSHGAQSIHDLEPATTPVLLLIGPEGGWTADELQILSERARTCNMGPSTFRAETAAVLGAFIVSNIISIR